MKPCIGTYTRPRCYDRNEWLPVMCTMLSVSTPKNKSYVLMESCKHDNVNAIIDF